MKIELTLEQYVKLAELVWLGNWMVNAYRDPDELIDEYAEAEQFFLSYGKKLIDVGLIKHFPLEDSYAAGPAMQDGLMELITEYDEETLWDKVSEGLVARDIAESVVEAVVEDVFDRVNLYLREFEEHGLNRVKVDWEGK